MNQPFYPFSVLDEAHRFDFVSVGDQKIPKTVLYHKTSLYNTYQLVMGDLDPVGNVDIYKVSDNGDLKKVMATVLQSILVFLEAHNEAVVVFAGSTPIRTRLYQIAIAHELDIVSDRLLVQGFTGVRFEIFERNKSYEGFCISLKKN